MFLGHYQGKIEELKSEGHNDGSAFISGIGLGNMSNKLICLILIWGLNGALDTLIS